MTIIPSPRLSTRQAIASHLRAWLRRRRDQRILDGLTADQLKDIGYRRLPSGGFSEREW